MSQIAIVVMTCDKYFGLVDSFLFYYFKNPLFEDASVYIVCETKIGTDTKNVTYISSSKLEWSLRLGVALSRIKQEYIFLMLDDFFVFEEPDRVKLNTLFNLLKRGNYLSVRSMNDENSKYLATENFVVDGLQVYTLNSQYYYKSRFLVGAGGFYNRNQLLDLIRKNENPWEFEYNASFRLQYFSKYKIGVIVAGEINYGFPTTGIIARGKIYPHFYDQIITELPHFQWKDLNSIVTTNETPIVLRYYRIIPRHTKKLLNVFLNRIRF